MMIIVKDVVRDVGGDMVIENIKGACYFHRTNDWTLWMSNTKKEGSFD